MRGPLPIISGKCWNANELRTFTGLPAGPLEGLLPPVRFATSIVKGGCAIMSFLDITALRIQVK
jgi:hypothetical protein